MKPQIFLFIAVLFCTKSLCQNYTIFKSGPNTWGGAYVAPVWSKTYNFNTPVYQSPNFKSGIQNYSYPSSSQTSDGISNYVIKNKWNFKTDDGDNRDRYAEMKETAREAIEMYSSKLKRAVKLFYEGNYATSKVTLDSLYGIPKTKRNFESYLAQGIWEIYHEATLEYFHIFICYQYFFNVKINNYNNALSHYNLTLSNVKKNKLADNNSIFPLTAEYYYIFDTLTKTNSEGFNNINLHDRFRADLFLVETLAGLGKTTEANEIMEKTMEFYPPLFKEIESYYAQIGINYFYLKNAQEARKYLEYYFNNNQSQTARYAVIYELISNEKSLNRWTEESSPECFKLIEDNMLFLDEIKVQAENIYQVYTIHHWYELYMVRSKQPDKFVAKVKPDIQLSLQQRSKGFNGSDNGSLSLYLTTMLKTGNTNEINKLMEELVIAAELRFKECQEKSEVYIKESKESKLKHIKELESHLSPDSGEKQVSLVTGFIKEGIEKYWKNYYREQAIPYTDALSVFHIREFCEAGGSDFVKKYAAPYLKELEKFTREEASYFENRYCGLTPKYKKSRKYPKSIE